MKNARIACLLLASLIVAITACESTTDESIASTQTPSAGEQRGGERPPSYAQEHYTKREVMIPMRDGVKLFTAIYEPKDQSRLV